MQQSSVLPGLDDEWRRWLAENLLLGAVHETLVAALGQHGCPAPVARAEIALAEASPYFRGATLLQARLAKRDWHLSLGPRHEALRPQSNKLESNTDPSIIGDHYPANRPALVSGLADHWPARRWTLATIAAAIPGDPEIELQAGRDTDPNYEARSDTLRHRMPLSAFLARLADGTAGNDVYLTANNSQANRTALAPLWPDIGELPGILAPEPGRDALLWIGPAGTVTPWHHDLTNNLLVQIAGRKRVHLVASAETPLMRNHLHCYSAFGIDATLADAPPDRRPRIVTAMLEPGDALFIPVGWWHHVEALETSISLSFTRFVWPNEAHRDYRTYGPV